MKMHLTTRSMALVTASTIAMIGLAPLTKAHSEEAPQKKADEPELVVVTGIRHSMQSAMAAKKGAAQVIDSITSEDVGKLPDPTVADALQRVPGVQITRNFGQGSRIVVRGLQSVRIQVDGRASYAWPLESSNGFGDNVGRNFGLETLSSGLINRINVYKTPTADQTEGGLGGVVDAVTNKPFDFKKPTAVVSAEVSRGSKSRGMGVTVNALFTKKFLDDKLGILVGANLTNEPAYLTSLARGGFGESGVVAGAIIDQNSDGLRDLRPTAVRTEYFDDIKRVRSGLSANATYKVSDNLQFYIDDTFSKLGINRNVIGGYLPITSTLAISNPAFDGNYVVAGTVANNFSTVTNFRGETVTTNTFGGGAKWTSEKMILSADVSDTTGVFDQTNRGVETRTLAPVTATFDFRAGDFPSLKLSDPTSITSIGNFDAMGSTTGFVAYLKVFTEEKAARFDATFNTDFGIIKSVKVGARLSNLMESRNQWRKGLGVYNPNSAGALTNIGAAGVVNGTPASAPGLWSVWTENFFPGFPSSILVANPLAVRNGDALIFTSAPLVYDPTQYFRSTEKTSAAYVTADFESSLGQIAYKGNFGVRAVKTNAAEEAIAFVTSGGILSQIPTHYNRSYTDVLPSANIAFYLRDDLIMRFAAAKVLARQALDQNGLAPNLVVSVGATPGTTSASSGNPNLNPTRLTNFDATLEWYFNKTGYLSGNMFYKSVTGFPVKVTQAVVVPGLESYGSINYTRPVNSDPGTIKGFELSYQQTYDFLPSFWNGLGTLVSFTYTDAKTDLTYASGLTTYTLHDTPLTGVSKTAYNVTAFYEKNGFNARLSYVWRDKRLYSLVSGANGPNGSFDATNNGIRKNYIGATGQLDGSISYDVTPSLNVYLNASNLNADDSAAQYYESKPLYQWRHDINETKLTLGFRNKF